MKPDIEKAMIEIWKDIRSMREEISEIRRHLSIKNYEMENDLLTVNQVTLEFSVNPCMIYSACSEGRLSFEKRGRAYRFKRQDVVQWLDDMQRNANGPSSTINDFVSNYLQKNPKLSF